MFSSEFSFSRLVKSKKTEFTDVIEHFFDKRNEENGHYGQTLIIYLFTGVAQLVEQWSPKPKVGSSNLSTRANNNKLW